MVEDEYLIRMLLEDMLATSAMRSPRRSAASPRRASSQPRPSSAPPCSTSISTARRSIPVADILAARGLPFVFVTGYGERSLPERYRDRPALQKPFQAEQLEAALAGLLAAA